MAKEPKKQGKKQKEAKTMFDGPMGANEMTKAAEHKLRSHYRDRLVEGDTIPEGMEIQGIDVIDPDLSRISHQVALSSEIDEILNRNEQPCIVVFKPITQKSAGAKGSFDTVNNPNRYAVMNEANVRRLLGNTPQHEPLQYNLTRRVNDIVSRPAKTLALT